MNLFVVSLLSVLCLRCSCFSILPQNSKIGHSGIVHKDVQENDGFRQPRKLAIPPFESAEFKWSSSSAKSFRSRRKARALYSQGYSGFNDPYHVHSNEDNSVGEPESNNKVIPSHSVMGVNVISGPDGHRIIIQPYKIGHQVKIGGKYNMPPYSYDLPNELAASSNSVEYKSEDAAVNSVQAVPHNSNCEPFCGFEYTEPSDAPGTLFEKSGSSENQSNLGEPGYYTYSKSYEEYTTVYPTEMETEEPTEDSLHEEGSGELMLRNNVDDSDSNDLQKQKGRLVGLFSGRNKSASCTTPKEEPGHCRPLQQCVLQEVLSNLTLFFQYMCLMPSRMVGICCPDNPVVGIASTEESVNVTEEQIPPTQPTDGCGFNSRTRIVGGEVSKPHEWTWMVALLKRNRFFCGGALINNMYVLTAAHCTLGINIHELTVRLGEYNFNNRTKHQQDISVAEVKKHAQFTTLTFKHDIALLKLRHPVKYSRVVGTICLPKEADDFSGSNATVVGWGTVSFGGAASPILRQVTIQVWNNTECDRTYAMEDIDKSFLCAGSTEEKDACQGDSGGPLMTLNDQGRWEVIGLVSWGRRCGDPMFPGVYTRVTSYLDWIQINSQ